MKKFWKKHKGTIFSVITLACVFILVTQVVMLGYVTSESMYPALDVGDVLLISRIYKEENLKVGDIIAFNHETQSGETEVFIKRIAAVSGDTVTIDDKEITLQDGEFYVLGDNAPVSWDSRYWDEPFVQSEDIKGKVVLFKERQPSE